jgi:FlaA1/EpsC-like NDP-sugar epimerase
MGVAIGALLVANLLRFDDPFPTSQWAFFRWLYLDLAVTPLVFHMLGLYRASWRYASVPDLVRLLQAVILRTALLFIGFVGWGYYGPPRSVAIIDGVLLFLACGGLRLASRLQGELRRRPGGRRPVLIVGAGESGEMIVREMRRRVDLDYQPVAFVDDDPEKHGVRIHDVPVVGGREEIPRIVRDRGVTEVIVAIPSASAADLREIRALAKDVRLKAVPAVDQMLGGPSALQQVREVKIEDLLGREAVVLDVERIRREIRGHAILVTGGGGSIGREMARQLASLQPAHLVLVDRSENNLFNIGRELAETAPDLRISYCVGDIQDEARMREILAGCRPRVVYHAAAYKHVPMMEFNLLEAVSNNVFGTLQMARLAAEHGASRFVLISTDKAVNPQSVMGKTKRVAELIVQSMNGGPTRFVSVRFGNVLGSDGSVVPIFREQIAAGGPITVTHAEATRYFMTIPEAVQLVLQAGSMGEGGEIFMLEMGRPVRIVDLARNLIELSGLRPEVDVEVVFTGLRPGEKLHEELYTAAEATQPTAHEKIVMLAMQPVSRPRLQQELEELRAAVERRDVDEAARRLSDLVHAYAPDRGARSPEAAPAASAGRVREAYT